MKINIKIKQLFNNEGYIHHMLTKIRKWIYSYPDPDNWFGVNFRTTIQTIFPCKHSWKNDNNFKRKCTICGERQMLVYHKYGNVRTSYVRIPITTIDDLI